MSRALRPLLRLVFAGFVGLAGFLGLAFGPAAGAAELADPTRPALLPPAPLGSPADVHPALQSLFISDARRVAVIGGRRFEVGDRIGDARIVAIELSGVRLRDGGGEWRLTLTNGLAGGPSHGSSSGDGIQRSATTRRDER